VLCIVWLAFQIIRKHQLGRLSDSIELAGDMFRGKGWLPAVKLFKAASSSNACHNFYCSQWMSIVRLSGEASSFMMI